jgi:predicted kinase
MLTYNLPTLLMLIGIPGSGKSTWLATAGESTLIENEKYILLGNEPFAIVCPDAIRQLMGNIQDQSNNAIVWQFAKDRVISCLERRMSIILDATNVNTTLRRHFLQGLPDCLKKAKVFYVNPEQACMRIKKDIEEKKLRANVPEETIYRMYGEYLYTVRVLSSEGFELL